MWLCGPFLPNSFRVQTSKFRKLQVRFKSNGSVTRLGFRAVVQATGNSRAAGEENFPPENSPIVFTGESTTNGPELIH